MSRSSFALAGASPAPLIPALVLALAASGCFITSEPEYGTDSPIAIYPRHDDVGDKNGGAMAGDVDNDEGTLTDSAVGVVPRHRHGYVGTIIP